MGHSRTGWAVLTMAAKDRRLNGNGPVMKHFDEELVLSANPHYYDYLHIVAFEPNGRVRLEHGDGQAMKFEAGAEYSIMRHDADSFIVEFTDVVIYGPYGRSEEGTDPPPFYVQCSREEGPFAIRYDAPGRISDESKWPCLFFTHRYRFDRDPLALGAPTSGWESRPQKADSQGGHPWCFYAHNDEKFCPLDEIDQLASEMGRPICWINDDD